jgi:hypothetical protein
VDLLWPCIAADGEGSAIGGRQSYGDHLVSGQLAAQGFPGSVDTLIQEGALNTDQQVVGQHTQKDVSFDSAFQVVEDGALAQRAPERSPQPCTVDLRDGQSGVSYRRLFAPYLRSAREIAVVDPYMLDYQIHNLMSFIDLVDPEAGSVKLALITAAGSNEEEVELSAKLDQVQESANAKKITFGYRFDRTKHDRVIETHTGWRITLGRGLDFFYKPEGRFSLGFIHQAQRKCKETSIIFSHG